jgi:hypothetical protein
MLHNGRVSFAEIDHSNLKLCAGSGIAGTEPSRDWSRRHTPTPRADLAKRSRTRIVAKGPPEVRQRKSGSDPADAGDNRGAERRQRSQGAWSCASTASESAVSDYRVMVKVVLRGLLVLPFALAVIVTV